ncbi:LuxR family transcriptional regulator [Elizabethkingia meningoseptica]|uniref:LuxR family transcriptional regulator n=1 Tax=Elizabethkingia meningoseptica TaxID=238 RepID=A0A1T3FGD9_ELIME|nr:MULTISPECIES: LuxR C-terminal-related transcriptional regulator [Elizabethkingia]AQX12946.1 LuxR family transcriptional regulator [Elizabethkingia meningoseptica]MBG0514477.1 PAS domain-containing protein [Elizabethkingia meningoseptica]MDE5430995.1 LuxR C-terminal-related transcriptional regulator [Elizabethkingia meningoseptica]MDE5433392.1 LuxR C-terminal-related transcriptional regulator [Elizabethkingia meningoseptica]MDE5448933.1 LuxR C-terminal-related transcriptional regulator [Eliz
MKTINKLTSVDFNEFTDLLKINETDPGKKYYDYYASTIQSISDFAMFPYFCYVSNNYTFKIEWISDNITQFTPFTKEDWLLPNQKLIEELYHPDDRIFLISALHFISVMALNLDESQRGDYKFNLYVRMLNKNGEYRWMLMQSVKPYINENKQIESTLCIFYDLSSFRISNTPLLSLTNHKLGTIQYFSYQENKIQEVKAKSIRLSNREKEVFNLIAQGYNSPQIAEKLFLSCHTVENHKRNLRKKTNTKNTAELITYVMTYNLLLI